jgi:hypothetical protein
MLVINYFIACKVDTPEALFDVCDLAIFYSILLF